MRESFGIAAFRSRQQVMRFESALRREGIFARVVTTPREVAMGCGLSVRFELNDLQRVKQVLDRENPGNLIGLYRVDYENGQPRISVIGRR